MKCPYLHKKLCVELPSLGSGLRLGFKFPKNVFFCYELYYIDQKSNPFIFGLAVCIILYSFGIDSNIIYLTKFLSSNISRIFDIVKYYIFFLLPQI